MTKSKRQRDPNQFSKLSVDIATGVQTDQNPDKEKNRAAKILFTQLISHFFTSCIGASNDKQLIPGMSSLGFTIFFPSIIKYR